MKPVKNERINDRSCLSKDIAILRFLCGRISLETPFIVTRYEEAKQFFEIEYQFDGWFIKVEKENAYLVNIPDFEHSSIKEEFLIDYNTSDLQKVIINAIKDTEVALKTKLLEIEDKENLSEYAKEIIGLNESKNEKEYVNEISDVAYDDIFEIVFDEVYGDVYGIPKLEDLKINYNIDKWPQEIKDFIESDPCDLINVPTYSAFNEYNQERAKQFTKFWQDKLSKYVGPITLEYVSNGYGITAKIKAKDNEKIIALANKLGIDYSKNLNKPVIEYVIDYISDKENLNYDDIAKQVEDTDAVKKYYAVSLQAIKDEFEFEPEITDIKDLDKYSFINGKFIWTADSPDQLKLDLGLESIDKDVLVILNESDAPAFTFDDLPKEVEEFIYDDSNYSIMPEIQDFVEENEEKEFDANEVPDLVEQIRDFALSLAEKDLLDPDIYDEISNAIDKFLEENADYFIER